MSQHWRWETEDSDWGVDVDASAGVLRWWGADKPRPGVPAYAQGGGGVDQPIAELLATGRTPYWCPPALLAEVIAAARKAPPTPDRTVGEASAARSPSPVTAAPAKLPVRPPAASSPSRVKVALPARPTIEGVLAACQATLRRLIGGTADLPETRRQLSVTEIPDDRPTQTCATEYVTELTIGDVATFRCTELHGGWSQGSADWTTADFAGTGPVRIAVEAGGVEIEGAPVVVELLATALRSSDTPGPP